jgi:Asparagine synthase.
MSLDNHTHAVRVAMVSGGMDSTVAARVATQQEEIDLLAYLDTGTGLDENREYVETLADHLGLQLWTLRTHEQYEDRVKENGFPGLRGIASCTGVSKSDKSVHLPPCVTAVAIHQTFIYIRASGPTSQNAGCGTSLKSKKKRGGYGTPRFTIGQKPIVGSTSRNTIYHETTYGTRSDAQVTAFVGASVLPRKS